MSEVKISNLSDQMLFQHRLKAGKLEYVVSVPRKLMRESYWCCLRQLIPDPNSLGTFFAAWFMLLPPRSIFPAAAIHGADIHCFLTLSVALQQAPDHLMWLFKL